MTIIRENFRPDFKIDGVITEGVVITLMGNDRNGNMPVVEWVYPYDDINILPRAGTLNRITVTITCLEGYTFGTTPNTRLSDFMGSFLTSNFVGDAISVSYVYNRLDYTDYWDILPLNIGGTLMTPPPVVVEQIPFNNIYSPSYDDLVSLGDYRLETIDYSGNIVEKDLGQFITSLYSIPFIVDDLGDETSIMLGNVATDILSGTVSTHIINKSLGSITIPDLTQGGSIGYSNIALQLFTPFTDSIELDPIDVNYNSISIYFNLDVISGKSTINIINNKTNKVFKSVNTIMGYSIPFNIGNRLDVSIENSILNNDVLTPYLEITYLEPNNTSIVSKVQPMDMGSGIKFIQSDTPMIKMVGTMEETKMIEEEIKKGLYYYG